MVRLHHKDMQGYSFAYMQRLACTARIHAYLARHSFIVIVPHWRYSPMHTCRYCPPSIRLAQLLYLSSTCTDPARMCALLSAHYALSAHVHTPSFVCAVFQSVKGHPVKVLAPLFATCATYTACVGMLALASAYGLCVRLCL